MNFENKLISGLFIKRYKRFFVDIKLKNKIVLEALEKNLIKEFNKNIKITNEKVFGSNTRFDFYLEGKNNKSFLEVKNVTLKRKDKTAEFPDSITSRGTKHLNELINATKKNLEAYLLFVIQREDCNKFEIAKDIDPEYSKALINAIKHNVKILCYDCKFSSKGIILNKQIKFHINE